MDDRSTIMIPGKWAIAVVILTASGIFGAGGWATWVFQTLSSINSNMGALQTEVRELRTRTDSRVANVESESIQIKFCLRMMESNRSIVGCKFE